MAKMEELGIEIEKVKEYDKFWQELSYLRYPLERVRVGLLRKANVIKKKHIKIPDAEEKVYDVIVGGGGPSGILYASLLAQKGYSVLLAEKNEDLKCGSTWNLSRHEFDALKSTEALTESQFDGLIGGNFERGEFRIWNEEEKKQTPKRFTTVLNVSLNETKYFDLLSNAPKAAQNLTVENGTLAVLKCITDEFAFVELTKENNSSIFKTRLFIDATGWTSLLARTVNYGRTTESWYNMIGIHSTQALDFEPDESGNPIGLICITYENETKTRAGMVQPILERFTDFVPGKESEGKKSDGDVIYYFTRTEKPVPLTPMFDELLKKVHMILPGFIEESGESIKKVDKTYYGHAAGYYPQGLFSPEFHQLSAGDRTLMVGVAAQQYSGLTGCAFGCLARNAKNICESIDNALKKDDLTFKTLQTIDIDPRERASQSITDLYAGSMVLDPYEEVGSVNRDWLSFLSIGNKLDDDETNAEVLRDKIRINTLTKMIIISAGDPSVIDTLFRNNRGYTSFVIVTFVKSYIKLLILEVQYALKKRQLKYFKAGFFGVCKIPFHLFHVSRFYIKSKKVSK